MKSKIPNFFWVSYTDLMTSLFFIMLVLYISTYFLLKQEQKKIEIEKNATEQQLRKIEELQASIKDLPKDFFEYDQEHKRFSLKENIEFETQQSVIRPKYKPYLIAVGESILTLVNQLRAKYGDMDIRYVIIIEGMASRDNYPDNFALSYRRALAVLTLWQDNDIFFDPSVCEIQIAGSGTEGVGRFPEYEEHRNQRILIHILPKIGKIE